MYALLEVLTIVTYIINLVVMILVATFLLVLLLSGVNQVWEYFKSRHNDKKRKKKLQARYRKAQENSAYESFFKDSTPSYVPELINKAHRSEMARRDEQIFQNTEEL